MQPKSSMMSKNEVDMVPKYCSKQRIITKKNLRIREDSISYLYNLKIQTSHIMTSKLDAR